MKTHLKTLIGITVTALLLAGCSGPTYVTTPRTYYHPSSSYSYGDGQPEGYYYNPNEQTYQYQQPATVLTSTPALSFNDFYTQLSPHGVWVNISPYGQVWIAGVRDFQPYSTNGYWAYTTYGWTWVSNYPWGWAPFHYGRWGYHNRYGWYWVPGYEWGPAWVVWSSSADMYGWAPLMPGMNYSVRLSVNHFPSSYWTFMPCRYMGHNNLGGYYVNRSKNVTIINNTTIINNYGTENNGRYNMGPNASDVQRHTGRAVQPLRVSSASDSRSTGINNDELRVYRPATSQGPSRTSSASTNDNRATTPPSRTQTEQPANQRSTTSQSRTSSNSSSETREYRPTQEQPPVTNRAAPQTTRQIQRAQSDDISTQQQQQQRQAQPQQQQSGQSRQAQPQKQQTQQRRETQTQPQQQSQQRQAQPQPQQSGQQREAEPQQQSRRQSQSEQPQQQQQQEGRSSTTTTTPNRR